VKENKMAGKKFIELKVYGEANNKSKLYEGRLLGLVDDAEFNALVRSSVVQNRCITKATMPLTNITDCKEFDTTDGLKGLRLVMAVKKQGHVECLSKKLFGTEKLDYISTVKDGGKTASFTGPNSWMTIKEKEV